MGYYINKNSKGENLQPHNKAYQLISDGAKEINNPRQVVDDMVCVVENGMFDAAAYIYNQKEFEAFNDPIDLRRKTWLKYEHASSLSGYEL